MRGLVIRDDRNPSELRRFAADAADRRAALRALAIASALEGASRSDAARVIGRERQSLRDAVVRYNAEDANAGTMDLFLAEFANTLPETAHVALVVYQAGWHDVKALHVPDNITLIPLPPYSPELNPVERIWLYLRERFLSFRLHQDFDATVNALCQAWNALRQEAGRLSTLTSYPWIKHALEQVIS